MERVQQTPVFFTGQLFDYLKIDFYKRATAQSKLEYLRLTREDIAAITKGKALREGGFGNMLYYIEFELRFGSLLCVFYRNGTCCRSYFFSNISAN